MNSRKLFYKIEEHVWYRLLESKRIKSFRNGETYNY